MAYGKNDRIVYGAGDRVVTEEPSLKPKKSFFGSPIEAFRPSGEIPTRLREQLLTGMGESAELKEQGKPGQAYLHSLGTLGGLVTEATMAPIQATFPGPSEAVGKTIGGVASRAPQFLTTASGIPIPLSSTPTEPIAPRISQIAQAHPTAARMAGDVLNIAGMVPAIKGAKIATEVVPKAAIKATTATIKGTGSVSENLGKSWLTKQMGITKTEAKKAGKTALEGEERIIDDISKYGLDSPMGMNKARSKTIDLLKTESDNAKNLLNRYVTEPGNAIKTINVDDIFLRLMDDLKNTRGLMLKQDQAATLLNDIHKQLKDKGLSGIQFYDKIPKIKKTMSEGLDLFNKGPYDITADPLPKQMGEMAYFKLMHSLNKEVDGLEDINKKISRLLRVKSAMEDAQFRAAKKGSTLRDVILESLVGTGALGAISHGNLKAAALGLLTGPAIYGANVAGPSTLMKTGRFLQGKKTLGDLIPPLTQAEQDALKYNVKNRFTHEVSPTQSVSYLPKENTAYSNFSRPLNLNQITAVPIAHIKPKKPKGAK